MKLIARNGEVKLYYTESRRDVFDNEIKVGFVEFPDGRRIFANINDVLSRNDWNIVGQL